MRLDLDRVPSKLTDNQRRRVDHNYGMCVDFSRINRRRFHVLSIGEIESAAACGLIEFITTDRPDQDNPLAVDRDEAWLTMHLAVNRDMQREVRWLRKTVPLPEPGDWRHPRSTPPVEPEVDTPEMIAELKRRMICLKPWHRDIVIMRVAGIGGDEIARRRGVSTSAVAQIFRDSIRRMGLIVADFRVAKGPGRSVRSAEAKLTTAKLDEDQVAEVLSLRGEMTYSRIADRFGMSKSGIGRIMRGETWSHMTDRNGDPVQATGDGEISTPMAKRSRSDVSQIKMLRLLGMTYRSISSHLGIKTSTLCDMCTGKSWG